MAHARTETIARPASNVVGTLRLSNEEKQLIDEHSAHGQAEYLNDGEQDPTPAPLAIDNPGLVALLLHPKQPLTPS